MLKKENMENKRNIENINFLIKEGYIIGGHKMYYLFSDELKSIDPIHFSQVFEPANTFFLLGLFANINEDFTFVDIGANIGYYSVLCGANNNNATIYSFEPHSKVFEVLEKNSKLYKNIIPFQCGISSKHQDNAILYCDNRNVGGHSFTNNEETWGDKKGFQPDIGMYTINSILCNIREFDIDFSKVKIIKIDVQGLETEILENIYDLLSFGCFVLIENCSQLEKFATSKNMKLIYSLGIDNIYRKC